MNWYLELTKNSPIIMAMIQFAILGTLGESFSIIIKEKSKWPFGFWMTIKKMFVWATLGVFIKGGFVGTIGFTEALISHNMFPNFSSTLLIALSRSTILCIFVGFVLVMLHRFLDNIIELKQNWSGVVEAMGKMIYIWIPLHTITFWVKPDFRIGLAALWSVVLSIMLTLIKINKAKK